MIDLFANPDRQGLGIELLLSTERIPFRRVRSASAPASQLLLIAAAEIPSDLAAHAASNPTLIVGDLPPQFQSMFQGCSTRESVLRSGQCVWCPLPVGAAFTSLLMEDYAPHPQQSLTPKLIPSVYYQLPERIRSLVQRSVYKKLQVKLAEHPDPSDYPVDRSGLMLLELLKAVIRQAAGGLVRLERWPAPFHAAAALTHDIEPTRYSYQQGLQELLQTAASAGHAPSLGLISRPTKEYLGERFPMSDVNVYCHGQEHRGETVAGSRDQIAGVLRESKFELEHLVRRKVDGFRSPRLDRSPDLFRALHDSGFRYSSSAPDVDRESMARYGGGVRWNLPFRMPLMESTGTGILSECLELPVSAPDCIQPLFGGETVAELRTAVRDKIDFIALSGGMYVGIVHAGVFGPDDSARRMEHLRFVAAEIDRPGLWIASMDEIASWWRRRESVELTPADNQWTAVNHGPDSVEGLRFVAEDSQGAVVCRQDLPDLAAGGSASLNFSAQTLFGELNYATSF